MTTIRKNNNNKLLAENFWQIIELQFIKVILSVRPRLSQYNLCTSYGISFIFENQTCLILALATAYGKVKCHLFLLHWRSSRLILCFATQKCLLHQKSLMQQKSLNLIPLSFATLHFLRFGHSWYINPFLAFCLVYYESPIVV